MKCLLATASFPLPDVSRGLRGAQAHWVHRITMGELNHECGVAAVFHAEGAPVSSLAPIAGNRNSVARLVPRMLLDMQNRGQLAAGMTSYHPGRSALLKTHKELGTVAEAF